MINVYSTVKKPGVSVKKTKEVIMYVLTFLHLDDIDVSVHYIGDTRMHTLNRVYRGKDKTTDVLSFAVQDGGSIKNGDDIGDIFISIPQIRRQARQFGVSFTQECLRMLIHGVLHALGYDHIKPKDAAVMLPLQEKILSRIVS